MSTASELPSLRLDVAREEALERAAAIVARGVAELRPGRPGAAADRRAAPGAARARRCPETGRARSPRSRTPRELLDESIAQPRPRYFAFVGSSGLEIGVLGDLLASCFDVNLAVWAGGGDRGRGSGGPLGRASSSASRPRAGAFTSGGTVSNMTALAAARERALPGSRRAGSAGARATLYCSGEAHYSDRARGRAPRDRLRATCASLPIDGERRLVPRRSTRRDRRGPRGRSSRRSPSSRPPGRR